MKMNKNVFITGASGGLGFALCEQFQSAGYKLYLVVRTRESKKKLEETYPFSKIFVFDITEANYEETLSKWIKGITIDILINNAGSGSYAPSLQSTQNYHLNKEFDTNCVAVLSSVKACLSSLKQSKEAIIINISSRRGSLSMQASKAAKGTGCSYSYRISKAAQNMLTLCLADDLEDLNIKVVAIHPGRLLTDMASSDARMLPKDSAKKLLDLVQNNSLENRDYICLETGKLKW